MTNSPYKGLRAKPLLRCSTAGQADTSIPDQLKPIRPFADSHEIELLDPYEMPGVSASVRANLEAAIIEVIAMRDSGEDFDAIIVYDLSRFSRSGANHFGKLMTMLEEAGIRLTEVVGNVGENELTETMRMLTASQNQQYAKSNATNSARGSRSSLEEGRRTYCTRPPYGIDRLYVNGEGRELYLMRDLGHGVRVKLHPETLEELQRYEKGVRFKKDKPDRVVLVPGAPERQDIVRRIFREYFIDRRGPYQITRGLNDDGIASANGKLWFSCQVLAIVRTTAYTGYGYAGMYSHGVYVMQDHAMPSTLPNAPGSYYRQIRPREDWLRIECERLAEYLPDAVRRLAVEYQGKYLDSISKGKVRRSGSSGSRPKRTSPGWTCLLSGILKERTTGADMRASTASAGRYQYYRLARGVSSPCSAKAYLDRLLPMSPIDRAVLEELEALLCGRSDLRDLLIEEIRHQDEARRGSRDEAERLQTELTKIEVKVASLLDQLDGPFAEQARSKLDRHGDREQEILRRLNEIDNGPSLSEVAIEAMADSILDQLGTLLDELNSNNDPSLKRICETLISKAQADLVEREVELEFAIPASMIESAIVCPEKGLRSKSIRRTNKWAAITIHAVIVELPKRCGGDCWNPFEPRGCDNCRRKRSAA